MTYTISSGDEGQDFSIAANGTIYTAKLLDRETLPIYNLVVTAKDMAIPPEPQLSSTVQVNINSTYIFLCLETKKNIIIMHVWNIIELTMLIY